MAKKKTTNNQIAALIEDQNTKWEAIEKYVKDLPDKIDILDQKVDGLEERMDRMKDNIEIIKSSLKRKVDIEEFETLVKRVSILEKKV
jgi:peptidoglycan hydrolase CwlO-like protein